jgi:hypothetical protein
MDMEAVAFVWDGSVMVPLDRFRRLAVRQFRLGQEYSLKVWTGRSDASHSHYFACIKKGWQNLPEEYAQEFPKPEYLRKWCLVQEGYADHMQLICSTESELARKIQWVRKMDPYCVVKVRQKLIIDVWNAQSQDHASMDHEIFQKSKTAVLERIANMCGISLEELTKNAKETA